MISYLGRGEALVLISYLGRREALVLISYQRGDVDHNCFLYIFVDVCLHFKFSVISTVLQVV